MKRPSLLLTIVFCAGMIALGLIWFYKDTGTGFQRLEVEVSFHKEHPSGYETTFIDLNTASKEELMTLPHVGEVLADQIILYREQNGGFRSVEELMEVRGIGESIFADVKDFLAVSERKLYEKTD